MQPCRRGLHAAERCAGRGSRGSRVSVRAAEPGAAAQVGRDLDTGGGRLVHLLDQVAAAQGRHFGPAQGPLAVAVQVGVGGDRAGPVGVDPP